MNLDTSSLATLECASKGASINLIGLQHPIDYHKQSKIRISYNNRPMLFLRQACGTHTGVASEMVQDARNLYGHTFGCREDVAAPKPIPQAPAVIQAN
jgi:hypothetical protein